MSAPDGLSNPVRLTIVVAAVAAWTAVAFALAPDTHDDPPAGTRARPHGRAREPRNRNWISSPLHAGRAEPTGSITMQGRKHPVTNQKRILRIDDLYSATCGNPDDQHFESLADDLDDLASIHR